MSCWSGGSGDRKQSPGCSGQLSFSQDAALPVYSIVMTKNQKWKEKAREFSRRKVTQRTILQGVASLNTILCSSFKTLQRSGPQPLHQSISTYHPGLAQQVKERNLPIYRPDWSFHNNWEEHTQTELAKHRKITWKIIKTQKFISQLL